MPISSARRPASLVDFGLFTFLYLSTTGFKLGKLLIFSKLEDLPVTDGWTKCDNAVWRSCLASSIFIHYCFCMFPTTTATTTTEWLSVQFWAALKEYISPQGYQRQITRCQYCLLLVVPLSGCDGRCVDDMMRSVLSWVNKNKYLVCSFALCSSQRGKRLEEIRGVIHTIKYLKKHDPHILSVRGSWIIYAFFAVVVLQSNNPSFKVPYFESTSLFVALFEVWFGRCLC